MVIVMARTLLTLTLVLAIIAAAGIILACGGGSAGDDVGGDNGGGGEGDANAPAQSDDHLKIGLMLNFSDAPKTSQARQKAFDLAIKHVNQSGGVLGQPVEGFAVDATGDPEVAVERARMLVDVARVHAIVGPNASSASLPVAEQISGPRQIPTISPSASSPFLTDANDNDYFFRTVLSDSAQGPVLADVNRDQGFDNVAVIHQNDAWGNGMAQSFQNAWTGQITAVSVELDQDSYLPQIQQSAANGAQSLVVLGFEALAARITNEAVASGIYSSFTFGDTAKRLSVIQGVGAKHLAGMYGVAGAPAPEGMSTQAWEQAFISEYGALPQVTYFKETYDAVMAIALAAQASRSLEGAQIREQLRPIGSAPGEIVQPMAEGYAHALELLANGEQIDYEGIAVSADWDYNGDLSRGYVGVWRFTADGGIEDVEAILIEP